METKRKAGDDHYACHQRLRIMLNEGSGVPIGSSEGEVISNPQRIVQSLEHKSTVSRLAAPWRMTTWSHHSASCIFYSKIIFAF
jgi:hypothetical protein